MIELKNEKVLAGLITGFCLFSVIIGLTLIWNMPGGSPAKMTLPKLSHSPGIAVVYLYGTLYVSQEVRFGMFGGTDRIVDQIQNLRKNPRVKAVVLRINSPGGSVAAVQEIYSEVKKFQAAGKKVVVSMGDVAASGGYYVAVAADRILANPGTITGSVGVYMEAPGLEGLLNKVGVEMRLIKSGKYKDIASPYRGMTGEEEQFLQDLINNTYNQFLSAVVNDRGLDQAGKEAIMEGQIYSGEQAKALGLVDELGNLDDAMRIAAEIAGIKGEPEIIEEAPSFHRFFDLFLFNMFRNSLSGILEKETSPRLSYIWK